MEVHGRLIRLRPPERGGEADDRAGEDGGGDEPPACSDEPPVAAEVDLLLRLRVEGLAAGFLGAHPAATLPEAHAHIRAKPSESDVRGAQPSESRMRVTSAFVRRTSPGATPTCL